MDNLTKAYEFAKKAHEGQTDKSGMPYILHPKWVSDHLEGENEKIVGLLHDTVEDTNTTLDDIEANFGKIIKDAVDAMTKREDEDYLTFVDRAMKNEIAAKVKMMDIRHNMDLSRSNQAPTEQDFWRMRNKYIPAYRMLTGHDLTLSEQVNTSYSDFVLFHLIWNLYQKNIERNDRITRNMEYILNMDSMAISDELKNYLEDVLTL